MRKYYYLILGLVAFGVAATGILITSKSASEPLFSEDVVTTQPASDEGFTPSDWSALSERANADAAAFKAWTDAQALNAWAAAYEASEVRRKEAEAKARQEREAAERAERERQRAATTTTTTTTKPKPAPSTGGGGVWDRLAQCESGGNWSMNSGNGFYGGLQFMHSTWVFMGGRQYAEYPHQASRGGQIAVAEKLLAASGWGQWPACSSKLGLR